MEANTAARSHFYQLRMWLEVEGPSAERNTRVRYHGNFPKLK